MAIPLLLPFISFSTPDRFDLLHGAKPKFTIFSRTCGSEHGRTGPLRWLDLAEDRLRLDRLSRNAVEATFFPWATPIPREARKSLRQHPALRFGPSGASPIVFGLQIAIEAAVVVGSKHKQEK